MTKKILAAFFSCAALFLFAHFFVLYGSLKQRESQICIAPEQMEVLTKTLNTTKTVCVDLTAARIDELEKQLAASKSQSSFWQKKFNDAASSTLVAANVQASE